MEMEHTKTYKCSKTSSKNAAYCGQWLHMKKRTSQMINLNLHAKELIKEETKATVAGGRKGLKRRAEIMKQKPQNKINPTRSFCVEMLHKMNKYFVRMKSKKGVVPKKIIVKNKTSQLMPQKCFKLQASPFFLFRDKVF